MINTLKIYNDLKKDINDLAAKKIAEFMGIIYEDLQNTVTKEDFKELKLVVKELGEAQKETEKKVEELAEAQRRTEKKVEELTEAQKRTENSIVELVEEHKKLAKQVYSSTKSIKNIQKELGGISNTIGYSLEDKAYPIFPKLLKKDCNIIVDNLYRKYIVYDEINDDEINIYGEGLKDGKEIVIIGEPKAKLGRKDVDSFLKLLKRVKDHIKKEIQPIFLCYSLHPRVEKYCHEKIAHIIIYKSYQLK